MAQKRVLVRYSRRGVLEGMARVFDLGATLNRRRRVRSGAEADATAIRSDWISVGQDIRNAIGIYKLETKERSPANPKYD
jgi:hypothetical protein